MLDIDRATNLVRYAEFDIAKYLNRPEDFMVIEWLEGVQQALSEALTMLGADPIPLSEGNEHE